MHLVKVTNIQLNTTRIFDNIELEYIVIDVKKEIIDMSN